MMFFRPQYSMQGWRVLSFLSTKKKPAPAREEKGQMIPDASTSNHSLSQWASEGVQPPLGWCHTQEEVYGAVVACVLLKTSFRSRKHSIMNAPLNAMCYGAKVNSCRSKELERSHMCLDSHHTSRWRLPWVLANGLTDPLELEMYLRVMESGET